MVSIKTYNIAPDYLRLSCEESWSLPVLYSFKYGHIKAREEFCWSKALILDRTQCLSQCLPGGLFASFPAIQLHTTQAKIIPEFI